MSFLQLRSPFFSNKTVAEVVAPESFSQRAESTTLPKPLLTPLNVGFVLSLLTTTLAPVNLPFNQTEFPNPLQKGKPTETFSQVKFQGVDTYYGGPGQVLAYDWKNPVLPVKRAQLPFLAQGLLEDPVPVGSGTGTNPRLRPPLQPLQDVQGLLNTLLGQAVTPFNQTEQPNPLIATRFRGDFLEAQFQGVDTFFGVAGDRKSVV